MLRLRDIMTTELVTVSPELSLRDTMELFVKEHVSGAPVVTQNKVVGVVSVTDLLAFAASQPLPDQDRAESGWEELESAAEAAREDQAAAAWFMDSATDEETEVVERFTDAEMRQNDRDRFAQHTVSEIMTTDVRGLTPNTPVEQAADLMREAGIHRVLVMSDGKLEGIVALKDIADAVADHKLTARTYVFGTNISYPARPTDRRS